MDYGDGRYPSHLSEFLEGPDGLVSNLFRCSEVFLHVQTDKNSCWSPSADALKREREKEKYQPGNKKQKFALEDLYPFKMRHGVW